MDNGSMSDFNDTPLIRDMSETNSSDDSGNTDGGDVSGLILAIMLRQSDTVYTEMKNLTKVMQQRNKKLQTLGEALSAVQSAMPSKPDEKGSIVKYNIMDYETGWSIPLEQYLRYHNLLPDPTINADKVKYTQLQGIVSTIQNKQDSLNNDSQTDSLRIQSMTNAYNKCLDQTSSVLSKASDTKDRILANMKS